MDIRSLTYFVEVAHQGSFTKAALQLNISQPALSKSIQNLEEELGIDLFIRNYGNLTLTESGKVILEAVEDLLIHFDSVQDKFETIRRRGRNTVSVGCSPLISSLFGAKVVTDFFKEHQELGHFYLEDTVSGLIERVFLMQIDIAVCVLFHQEYKYLGGVAVEPFYRGELVATLAAEKNEQDCIYLDDLDLKERNCIFPNGFAATQLAGSYLETLRSVFYTDRIEAIIHSVTQKGTIALIPDVARSVFPQDVEFLKLRSPIEYEIALITKGSAHASQNVKSLKKYITMNFLHTR